jgi:hypothetical protein
VPISFMDLGPESCRYVVGEPAGLKTLFCGEPRAGAAPYCQAHAVRCYQAATLSVSWALAFW